MVRKLALVLASLTSVVPSWAHALGLGDVKLRSYLNQPLDAEIPLVAVGGEDVDGIKVGLASQADFARAGIDYYDVLSQLRFIIVRREDGTAYVRVTTPRDFREPFLNFLLEVDWNKGRILREYTLLIDPPALIPEKTTVAQTPAVVAAAPAPTARPAPTPAPAARTPAAPVTKSPAAPAKSNIGDSYGPTQRNDTLWQIANRVRPDTQISVEQTMLGLLRANPEAFIDDNINRMKAGYVLQVPAREEMASLTRAEAVAEVRRQTRVWRQGGKTVRTTVAATPAPAPAGRLELLAPEGPGESVSGAGPKQAPAGDAEPAQKELALAREAAEAQRQENSELRSRLAQLEEQITNQQRLTSLKDEQLAALQRQLEELQSTNAVEAKPAAVETPAAEPKSQETKSVQAPVAEAEAPKPATTASPAEESIVGRLLDFVVSNLVAVGAAAAVLVLLIVGLLVRGSRKPSGFQESILLEPQASKAAPAPKEDAAREAPQKMEAASSYISDFAVSNMDSIQSEVGEADPLTEADVFLAYGRFQPAEAMIKEAIDHEPDRLDYRVKLLEIYHAARNQGAFETEAQKFSEMLDEETRPLWGRVADMGRDLCPDSPLFTAESELQFSEEAGQDEASDEFNLNLEEAFTLKDATPAADDAIEQKAEDNLIDFDLGDLGDFGLPEDEPKPQTNEAAAVQKESGLDFDAAEFTDGTNDLAGSLADELSDLADSIGGQSVPAPTSNMQDTAALDLRGFDAVPSADNVDDFDFAAALDELPEDALGDESDEDGPIGDIDEVGTKLDLAKAYIDMGDPEGARSILDEVLQEGDHSQKGEAQELMRQIS